MTDKPSNLTALSDWIICRRCKPSEKTEGGIIIPEVSKKPHVDCFVVSVGPGRATPAGVFVETEAKVGDHIMVTKGYEFDYHGVTYIAVRDHVIDCVIEGSKASL